MKLLFKTKKGETNIHSIFEILENKDNKNLSLITSKEDKYKRLLSSIISSINNLSTSENFHPEIISTQEKQTKENETYNKEISDVGTISFLDNI